jgi:hypothetical protein
MQEKDPKPAEDVAGDTGMESGEREADASRRDISQSPGVAEEKAGRAHEEIVRESDAAIPAPDGPAEIQPDQRAESDDLAV